MVSVLNLNRFSQYKFKPVSSRDHQVRSMRTVCPTFTTVGDQNGMGTITTHIMETRTQEVAIVVIQDDVPIMTRISRFLLYLR